MQRRYGALLFFLCASLAGQPAAHETRDLAVTRTNDGTSDGANAAGAATIQLRNQYSAPATAWILQCETSKGGSRYHWNDEDLSLQTKPLDPGKEIEFKIPPRPAAMMQRFADSGTCEDFHLIAAVFADGTVSGDLRWLNAIVTQRRQAYRDIAKATEILNTAISNGADTPSVIKQLTDWRKDGRPGGMPGRHSATNGANWGWNAKGTAPPPQTFSGGLVASAALWLVDTQKVALPDAVKALADWRDRLAKLAPVTETGEPAPPENRMLTTRPFTPPPDPELTGKAAPEFTLKDVDGREFTLASLRGKTVLLDFWATWCGPCREEMPHIKALYDQFKDKGLVVVCIDSTEPAEKARKYFEEQKYSFVNLLDPGENVSPKYGAGGIPRTVLVDKDGVVRYFHRGWGARMDLTPEVNKLIQ